MKLSLGVNSYGKPLTVMVPKPGKGFINPTNAFYKTDVQVLGIYTGTEDFENKYVFVTLDQAKDLLRYKDNQVTAIALKVLDKDDADEIATTLQKKLGSSYSVKTKEQLNEVFYKVINTENFVSYLIFTLIIIIALFNVIGAIIMMIIDKKQNLQTLNNLGTTIQEIKNIFVYQGFLLTFLGMLVGLILGIILVFLQDTFGLFMITENLAYPVEFQFYNFIIVIFTITVLGFVAAKIASSRINQKFIEK
ncbi:MAG: FtsX-like permease family protein [Polaribacter sp.]|jgi:lipoprotein-releasing system permease protein